MKQNKLLFFDVDGTLCDFTSTMPESTKKAIYELHENGYLLALSTGRSKGEVYPWLFDMPFDGMVCAAGAYVEWNGNIIYEKYMDIPMLKTILEYLESNNATYVLEGRDNIRVKSSLMEMNNKLMKKWVTSFNGLENVSPLPEPIPFDTIEQVAHIHKLNFHGLSANIDDVKNEINSKLSLNGLNTIHAISFSMADNFVTSGEITMDGIHKAHGINALLKCLGLSMNDVIAFGDSMNDYEMIKNASIGVAMGNACSQIKNIANIITDDINQDGIYNAVKKLGLI